jgi:2-hydroxycyclohexanecarboxyl-CoA dehydrogenase
MNKELLKIAPDPERLKRSWDQLTPMGRWGTPGDVSSSVSFFLSDDSSFITGVVLAVDGGAMTIAPGQIP